MRTAYHAELDSYTSGLAELLDLARSAITRATTALMETDDSVAAEVIAGEEAIHRRHHRLDDEALTLLARQQPVATDLRLLVAGLRVSSDLERMGILARHIAELVRERYPRPVLPDSMNGIVSAMGDIAQRLAREARSALESLDATTATALATEDDEMDRLQQALYRQVLESGEGTDLRTGMDVVQLGRYYERFADHAVSVGKRVAFIVGGHATKSPA
ncbi:phosphate signaling complex protein PhoU [Amycolatopsis mongoliensis]|uniref:Phosphate-specific transport system accessory protein PhoU n=1 Tax=Amycolatopsis mongoliensis TaxID=715475 RepID=A0A9Y2JZ98_9PSEU|nr:phosphate signaling complex protein PhoU [Amycolatopsis sp. 4-36]WIY06670.1 phosphate signaling complex protein PhoU [Amycolatopsis sp. 4-36]